MKNYEYIVDDVLKVVNWFKIRNFSDMKDDRNVEPLSQMKIMKLLYYVQGVTLAAYGKKMFPDELLAWKYGPVVKKVYDVYHGQYGIVDPFADGMPVNEQNDYKELCGNTEALVVLEAVHDAYGDMSAIDLMNKTHEERPWKETPQSGEISNELIGTYFKEEILNG